MKYKAHRTTDAIVGGVTGSLARPECLLLGRYSSENHPGRSLDESFADLQDRVFRSRHYASPRMVTRSRIADAFYAAIGHTVLVPISPERVEAAIDQAHEAISSGEWPRSMLAYHCQGLREWLGLPAGD